MDDGMDPLYFGDIMMLLGAMTGNRTRTADNILSLDELTAFTDHAVKSLLRSLTTPVLAAIIVDLSPDAKAYEDSEEVDLERLPAATLFQFSMEVLTERTADSSEAVELLRKSAGLAVARDMVLSGKLG